jgi:hypothetical protein
MARDLTSSKCQNLFGAGVRWIQLSKLETEGAARRFGSEARKLATKGAASWRNMAHTCNMIARRQIDRTQLLQFGKVILLLVKREELLVKLPAMTQPTKEIVPIEGLGRAS